ncbi:hypothetical protein WG70_22855 [Burkholderia oklahomensis EO147]|nr:hypothetical protein WG70_22855 [Burkholderia oklahomensis EO147]KUY68715.1 hypothetical protein WG70_24355 [Burkholderia oklahomensis EO147]
MRRCGRVGDACEREGLECFSSGVHAPARASMSMRDVQGPADGASAERSDSRRLSSNRAAGLRRRTPLPAPMRRAACDRLRGASLSARPSGRVSAPPRPA